MLISCKCLNFIATSNSSQQQAVATAATVVTPTADAPPPMPSSASTHLAGGSGDGDDCSMSSITSVAAQSTSSLSTTGVFSGGSSNNNNNQSNSHTIAASLMHAFLQKYPRNFIFYSQCMDFFKQSIGPIPDLTINAVNQREVIYSLTLDIANAQTQSYESWQISICINCNAALCAKRLQHAGQHPPSPPQYLINCSLLTNNEELAHRRADKSFSETFDLLIMDHPQLLPMASSQQQNGASTLPTSNNFSIGSLTATSGGGGFVPDAKQQRLRQLQHKMQQRLKREIAETDERIQRYTEQQFALLKSFREKSEQEYAMLIRLIQRVPEHQLLQQQQQQQAGNLAGANSGEWFDRTPPALEVTGGVVNSYTARRRNTIGSRRDINSSSTTAPTTPTTPNPNNIPNMLTLPPTLATPTSSAMDTTGNTTTQGNVAAAAATTTVLASNVNRKMSNFDTPPATPEATPMSVGNSPTFRQQQQLIQQQQQQLPSLQQQMQPHQFVRLASNSQSFQQQFPTPTSINASSSIEPSDDCLFELEGVDSGNVMTAAPPSSAAAPYSTLMSNFSLKLPHHAQMQGQQQQHQHQHFHRSLSIHHHQHENNMSDLDESDDAEEAEDALDLETSLPISMAHRSTADVLNFGKSLPIAIANSPMAARSYMGDTDEDELDNNVDIAASIKALAKSVHGEAVFGDLPRPRLRSQI